MQEQKDTLQSASVPSNTPVSISNAQDGINSVSEHSTPTSAEVASKDESDKTLTSLENCEVTEKVLDIKEEKTVKETDNTDSVPERKDDILPSLGILPEVESSNGANIHESKSARLPSHIESGAVGQSDPSEVSHKVKRIKWKDSDVPIITQNNNGPCPLLSILNAMILKVRKLLIELLCIIGK